MSRTLIDGTSYEINGGKTLIDGTSYEINGGKTLIDGTVYTISFVEKFVLSVSVDSGSTYTPIKGLRISVVDSAGNQTVKYSDTTTFNSTVVSTEFQSTDSIKLEFMPMVGYNDKERDYVDLDITIYDGNNPDSEGNYPTLYYGEPDDGSSKGAHTGSYTITDITGNVTLTLSAKNNYGYILLFIG